jgi:hypothetical protein
VPQRGDRVDALIGQVLPGTHSEVEFFRDLTGWLATSIAPQTPVPADANTYLAQLTGDCSVRANIFETVAERLGVPVQNVAFQDVPYQGQHAGVEVAVAGHWLFFDPTTGVYLAWRGTKEPLSLPEARAHPARVQVMESTSVHWRGVWSAQHDFTYVPAPADILRWHGRIAFDLRYTYLQAPEHMSDPG